MTKSRAPSGEVVNIEFDKNAAENEDVRNAVLDFLSSVDCLEKEKNIPALNIPGWCQEQLLHTVLHVGRNNIPINKLRR